MGMRSHRSANVVLGALALAALAGCGTFQLGTSVPPAGKTADQQQLDTLTCKDQASMAVNSGANQAGDFLLGMTIIGVPIAYQSDKQKQRDVFAACMRQKGYQVTPATD
jgi:hypothetical protein